MPVSSSETGEMIWKKEKKDDKFTDFKSLSRIDPNKKAEPTSLYFLAKY